MTWKKRFALMTFIVFVILDIAVLGTFIPLLVYKYYRSMPLIGFMLLAGILKAVQKWQYYKNVDNNDSNKII